MPITAELAPNVYVSVIIMKGIDETSPPPSFKMGLVPLKVSVAEKELQVIVTPRDAPVQHRARQRRSGPSRCAVAPRATMYLGGADAGCGRQAGCRRCLAGAGRQGRADAGAGPDGHDPGPLLRQRDLGVQTGVTLVLNIDRLVAQLAEDGKGGGGGGGDGGMREVRTEFPDIAFWRASVTTDAQGARRSKSRCPTT